MADAVAGQLCVPSPPTCCKALRLNKCAGSSLFGYASYLRPAGGLYRDLLQKKRPQTHRKFLPPCRLSIRNRKSFVKETWPPQAGRFCQQFSSPQEAAIPSTLHNQHGNSSIPVVQAIIPKRLQNMTVYSQLFGAGLRMKFSSCQVHVIACRKVRGKVLSPLKASIARYKSQRSLTTPSSTKLRYRSKSKINTSKQQTGLKAPCRLVTKAQTVEQPEVETKVNDIAPGGRLPKAKEGIATRKREDSRSRAAQAVVSAGIIACVKIEDHTKALEAARAALDGGITILELTMSVPGALEGVNTLVHEYPDAIIGVGTIFTKEEAVAAADAGAHFVMSPIFNEEILDLQLERDLLYIPGAMTPTEIWTAYRKGCEVVKVFPATEATLRALRRPLARLTEPQLSLVASHGIEEGDICRYLGDRLAAAVVLSDAIFGHDRDAAAVTAAAKRVIALAQSHRKP